MKKVRNILLRVYHIRGLKYIVVSVLAVVVIGFVDENSVWKHFRNRQHIGQLQAEIARYKKQNQSDLEQIKQLDSDPKSIEKIARERYFMKADDEDIFVLSDDEEQVQTNMLSDETAK